MGIALFAFTDLLSPLHALASRWVAPSERRARRKELRYVAIRPSCGPRAATAPDAPASASHRAWPLRVVRVVESNARARDDGRVVISGRMADVCAELDRLAALESGRPGASARGAH